ncbi:GGDEF domain-containing protein [Eubacteriales bacterium OttesenSCG-928-N14]|nr:GGDEF domain-containing protein [Eubacteriales bacterium OttesenSCG-928-N14]
MNKVRQMMNQKYFGKELPFNYRIYMIFFFECLFISIVSATTNTLLRKGIIGVLFQWLFILFCIVVLFLPTQKRMAIVKPLLLFVSFVYIPFLFFQTAGYEGTAGLFSLLAVFLIAIVFNGKARTILVLCNLVLLAGICALQYLYPHIVIPHAGAQAAFIDYMVALVLAVSGIAILGTYVKNTFEEEQMRIHALLRNEEYTNKKLEDLSNRDPLTNTFNRRYLSRYLESTLNTGEAVCIIMLDLDDFKQINDRWGHLFGDEVLMRFAATVQENLRENDVLARTGGEEFVVALSNMALARAKEIAGRILESVNGIVFENGAHITVSIGLVQARAGEGIDMVLNRADRFLYDAKSAGKNMVVYEE